jgi:hypothetical protein
VLQIVSGEFDGIDRCFIFALNDDKKIELWELTTDDYADRPSASETTRITWSFETGSYSFGDGAENLKKLQAGRIWASQIRGAVDFSVKYRPDQHPVWLEWVSSWTKKAAAGFCPDSSTCLPRLPLPQQRTYMPLPVPAKTDEATDNKPLNVGHEFQFRIEVTGSCQIRRMRLRAQDEQEKPDGGCPHSDDDELALNGCDEEIFGYHLESEEVLNAILSDDREAVLDDNDLGIQSDTGTDTVADDDSGAIEDDDGRDILGD